MQFNGAKGIVLFVAIHPNRLFGRVRVRPTELGVTIRPATLKSSETSYLFTRNDYQESLRSVQRPQR